MRMNRLKDTLGLVIPGYLKHCIFFYYSRLYFSYSIVTERHSWLSDIWLGICILVIHNNVDFF